MDTPTGPPETSPRAGRPSVESSSPVAGVDADLSAAVSYSLTQSVEARLRGIRNYTRLLRETQRTS